MKSLFFICLLLVLCGMAASLLKQYIYNSLKMNWTTAQGYCRQQYGNLISVNTKEEHQTVVTVTAQNYLLAWIGLTRTAPHADTWQWSDGDQVNYTKWNSDEPDDQGSGENCTVMDPSGWRDTACGGNFPSICFRRFTLVKETKTWDEALKYCRTQYTDLAFVDSKTPLDLLKTETQQAQTASVWTGLRFLDGKWFWVNRMLLGSLVSVPSCPARPYHCGAYNFNTYVWENLDCNQELNFLCYH